MAVQKLRQLDGRLSAKRHHDAHRFFHVDDIHDVFRCERFKV